MWSWVINPFHNLSFWNWMSFQIIQWQFMLTLVVWFSFISPSDLIRVSSDNFLALLQRVLNSLAIATRGLTMFPWRSLIVVSLTFPSFSSSRTAYIFWSLILNCSTQNGGIRRGSGLWWNKRRLSLLVSILTVHLTILWSLPILTWFITSTFLAIWPQLSEGWIALSTG